jgi:hypothetical protein
MAAMDNVQFSTPQPPKDWNERFESTRSMLIQSSGVAAVNLSIFGGTLKEKSSTAGVVIGERSTQFKQKLVEQ